MTALAKPRSRRFDDAAKRRFLNLVRKGRLGAVAAEQAGFAWATVKRHLEADPEFAMAYQAMQTELDDQVETALFDKAKGGSVEAIRVWLYNRRKDRWQDQKIIHQQITGPNGGPIQIAQAHTIALREVLTGADTRSAALGLVRSIDVASRDAGTPRENGDPFALDGDGERGILPAPDRTAALEVVEREDRGGDL